MEPNFHQDFPAESRDILPVPYLEHVAEPLALRPGRQLFVDDWLIAGTDCERIFHPLVPYPGNPVLKPETELELDRFQCPLAVPFNDGVWYDPADRLYKFFYHAGWFHGTAYAVSRDGIRWERPNLGIVGNSNQLIPPRPGYERDGGLVGLDQHTEDPAERWKMFLSFRHETGEGGELYTSADGIHWNFRTTAGPCDDNSSFYYDPFLRRWIFSIRNSMGNNGRARAWLARRDFIAPPWTQEEPINWVRADSLDPFEQETGMEPQLYDLNATPYESLMLGIFAIFHGPENNVCERLGIPKRNDLHFAFSRDGYHWSRPAGRTPALACTRREGDWDRGYLHAAGGICLVFRDKLRFYYGGWSGKSALAPGEKGNSSRGAFAMYAGGATGFAELRRDGFASMHAHSTGTVTTRLQLLPGRFLRINAALRELRAELLDRNGTVIPGYSRMECLPFSGDSCNAELHWADRTELPAGEYRIRFHLNGGNLYAFWGSDHHDGCSGGYLAAGSGDYASDRDI